jgi:hypothetical protein
MLLGSATDTTSSVRTHNEARRDPGCWGRKAGNVRQPGNAVRYWLKDTDNFSWTRLVSFPCACGDVFFFLLLLFFFFFFKYKCYYKFKFHLGQAMKTPKCILTIIPPWSFHFKRFWCWIEFYFTCLNWQHFLDPASTSAGPGLWLSNSIQF